MLIDPVVLICSGLFIVLMLFEVPLPFGMLFSSILYAVFNGQSFVMFAQKIASSFADFSMLAVPAFLFVGIFMNEMGLTEILFHFCEKWLGNIKGGLAHANILGSMIFAGMSGSALADAGGMGVIEVDAMRKAGYDENFSVACSAASSTIGPIIPPSINFVIWAFLSQTSTLAMFIGGLVPGVLMGLVMMIWVAYAIPRYHIKVPAPTKSTWKEKWVATLRALPAIGGPAILIGGMMTGAFTPTECGVVGAAYCFFVGLFYKKLNGKMLIRVLKSTLSSSAMVMALCATGLVFNWMIVTSGLLTALTNGLLALGNKYLVLFLINILFVFLGCFIGSMQILIMMAPLLIAVAEGFGLNLVHVGVMAVFNLVIGLITPPMAPALFVTCKATGVSFNKSLRYTIQFLVPLCLMLLVITYIPEVVLWLPRIMGVL
jgi:tripartite ATP-independent transporter DctM subunit